MTQRADGHLLAFAFVDEDVDEDVPRRLVEQFRRAEQAATELAPSIGAARIFQRNRMLPGRIAAVDAVTQDMRGLVGTITGSGAERADTACAGRGDNNVIDDFDIEREAKAHQPARGIDVALARLWISTGVIVDQNESRGAMFHGPAEDRAGIEFELPDGPAMQRLVRDQPIGCVEEENAQHLVGERAHGGHEILVELRAGGIDRLGREVGLQALEKHIPRTQQDIGDRSIVTEDTRERLGRLRQDSIDAAEFFEQRAG